MRISNTLACTALLTLVVACPPAQGSIGVILVRPANGESLVVRESPDDGCGRAAGLVEGTELLLVEGKDVRGMAEDRLRASLRGPSGSPVHLTVRRGGNIERVTVTRCPFRESARRR